MTQEDQPTDPVRRRALTVAAGVAAASLAGGAALGASASTRPAPVFLDGLKRFDGQSVLITGATSGIGRAAAEAFAREGANVVFCGRREALGREIEQGIRAAGGEAFFIRADVRKAEEIHRLVDQAVQQYGQLDIALNNAGVSFRGAVHETSIEDWDDLQATNVRGVFIAMKYQIPHMLARGGQIIVTSSVNIVAARPGLGAYNASKRALTGLVQTAALEYGDKGIRINAICPGTTDTEMVRGLAGILDAPDGVAIAALNAWAQSNVSGMKRVASSEEMATAILAMASPEMGYMNGSMVVVDGGMSSAL